MSSTKAIWYKFNESTILPFAYEAAAFRYALENNFDIRKIKPINIKSFSNGEFLTLITQVIHVCERNNTLQAALLHLSNKAFPATSANTLIAIKSQLNHGASVSETISFFVPENIQGFFSSMPIDGTEESKICSLKIIQDMLESQAQTTTRILKAFVYPFLVIQVSLGIALLNQVLSHKNIVTIGSIWLAITIAQVVLYFWTAKGACFNLICRMNIGFRVANQLALFEALIQSGEPLHSALSKLISSQSNKSNFELFKALLALEAGASALDSLPKIWFSKCDSIELQQVKNTGDLQKPLRNAILSWHLYNERILQVTSKAIPILGIVIAAVFVSHALINLYLPLMEVNDIGI